MRKPPIYSENEIKGVWGIISWNVTMGWAFFYTEIKIDRILAKAGHFIGILDSNMLTEKTTIFFFPRRLYNGVSKGKILISQFGT